jgi:hypothetical protein
MQRSDLDFFEEVADLVSLGDRLLDQVGSLDQVSSISSSAGIAANSMTVN